MRVLMDAGKAGTARTAQIGGATSAADSFGAPSMGDNLVEKVHYRLGSRNC
jgi:hypothetical protein